MSVRRRRTTFVPGRGLLLVAALAGAAACDAAGNGSDTSTPATPAADGGAPAVGHDAGAGAVPDAASDARAPGDAGASESGNDDAGAADAAPEGGLGAAETARQKVLAFLAGVRGHETAIGIEDKDSSHPHADSDTMASMAGTGDRPSFWSADWGFGAGAVDNRETIVQEGERQWAAGAIVQFIYHACPLTMDEYCQWSDVDGSSLTDAQWQDLVTPGGTLNQAWLARLDTIAKFFQELKDAGVAPLFRPLHEMNGSWAWWQGRPGPGGSPRLYQITHDYLVKTRGLDNIVWVWNLQDYATLAADVPAYDPGADYFDVAALDVYDTGYTDGNYQAMLGGAAGKPIGVAECQLLPDPSTLAAQPQWTYVAMWPDFFGDDTTRIPALFQDDAVLKLSQMPGWK